MRSQRGRVDRAVSPPLTLGHFGMAYAVELQDQTDMSARLLCLQSREIDVRRPRRQVIRQKGHKAGRWSMLGSHSYRNLFPRVHRSNQPVKVRSGPGRVQ